MGVGKISVKLSFYSMVYPTIRSYVIIQVCVCFCPSVCLPVLVLSVYVSVCPCVPPSACMHIFGILFITLSVCMFLSVCSFDRLLVHLVFRQYKCIPVRVGRKTLRN